MAKSSENQHENYVELAERQVFEKARKDIEPIKQSLIEKTITIDEAKAELKKINDWIQWSKIEQWDKYWINQAFEKLIDLEKNIDENSLRNEVDWIIKLLESFTKRELKTLQQSIKLGTQHTPNQRERQRPDNVQKWIDESSNNLVKTANEASQDKNIIARKIWERLKILTTQK